TPLITRLPSIDPLIEPFRLPVSTNETRYLITSPEHHMKRLLCQGSGSIYQIAPAFRQAESGHIHNPEFLMLEWYRVGMGMDGLMDETGELLDRVFGCGKGEVISYRELFYNETGLDPFESGLDQWQDFLGQLKTPVPEALCREATPVWEILDYVMGFILQPKLQGQKPLFVKGFPISRGQLAQSDPKDEKTALRFEVYLKGVELANGYQELTCPEEQQRRFHQANLQRKEIGLEALPVDIRLQKALEKGLPLCSGIALGLDRLIMLALGKERIDEVLSFSWERS
ncbi:MAG: EF-P lysine aminoacylase EpmA, partial [Deltaproteobacteria bacterium]|nr:EF-P lysine aminoacylase EpmA [Deltaproteobacteria bacterium]